MYQFDSLLTPSLLGRIFILILLIIWRFYTASETHVGIKIVQTPVINLLTSIDLPNVNKIIQSHSKLVVEIMSQYQRD